MFSRVAALCIGILGSALSAPAHACSCASPITGDLAKDADGTRQRAGAVYVARAYASPERRSVTLEVLEFFKGQIKVGQQLRASSGGGGSCTFPLREGKTYLIYSEDVPTKIKQCSGTREISAGNDAELIWLRTGALPPVPKVLFRESVRCQPCDFASTLRKLIPLKASEHVVDSEEAIRLNAARAPFLRMDGTGGAHDRSAEGRTRTGRAFIATQGQEWALGFQTCRQRTVRRWCKDLRVSTEHSSAPILECIEPGTAEELCNEEKSRSAGWGPPEDAAAEGCAWSDSSSFTCRLDAKLNAWTGSGDMQGQAVIRCRPSFGRSDWDCRKEVYSTPARRK